MYLLTLSMITAILLTIVSYVLLPFPLAVVAMFCIFYVCLHE